MPVKALLVLRFNGDTADSVILDGAFSLGDYGYFDRG